jgi:serine/threonine protein kinase
VWRRSRPAADGAEAIPGYRDLHRVGRGGFSVVYRAHHEQLDRVVAVKVLSVELVDAQVRRRFAREVRLTSRLAGHPNVVTVLDSGTTASGRPYIAMEYFERGSLRDRLVAEGPLPVADVLRIGVKIAGALGAAHAEGVLHRDVKPHNILISRYGEPALADFGTARLAASLDSSARTEAFTPYHAAPELLRGANPSPAADLYSLGSTLYELLSGRPPYAGDEGGIAGLALRVLNTEPTPIARPDVPPQLHALIRQAMAKEPAERFPDAWALAQALQSVQLLLSLTPTDVPTAGIPPEQWAEQVRRVPEALVTAPDPADTSGSVDAWLPMRPVELAALDWPGPVTESAAPPPVAAPVAGPVAAPLAGPVAAPVAGPVAASQPVAAHVAAPATPPWVVSAPVAALPAPGQTTTVAHAGPAPRRRRLGAPALLALALLAVAGAATPLLLHAGSGGAPTPTTSPPAPTSPVATEPPPDLNASRPAIVSIVDNGASVTLNWLLAAGTGRYPVAVYLQPTPAGQLSVQTLPPGATSDTVTGLDPRVGYCFVVGPVLRLGVGGGAAIVAWSAPQCVRDAHVITVPS